MIELPLTRFWAVGVVLIASFWLSDARAAVRTIKVPQDFGSIGDAMANSIPGDEIIVFGGRYDEPVTIDKSNLTIKGIDDPVLTKLIWITGSVGVNISGFTMIGGTNESHGGILAERSSVAIAEMQISGFHHAISVKSGSASVSNCVIEDSFNVCIDIIGSEYRVSGCILSRSGAGVAVSGSRGIIENCLIANNTIGIQCANSNVSVSQCRIVDNLWGAIRISGDMDLGSNRPETGGNVLMRNEVDIRNDGTGTVSAINNYWGDRNGPLPDRFEGKIEFRPWLMENPFDEMPVRLSSLMISVWARFRLIGDQR